MPCFLERLRTRGVSECVVLSTCNRTEVYFVGGSRATVIEMLAERAGMSAEELRSNLYAKACVCAACHLFRVVSGLDSAVLGETEIVAQVKEAWRSATQAGTSGRSLDLLFQRSLEAGKRIRTETDLCRTVTSTGSLAVRELQRRIDDIRDARIVLLGAGKIAERILKDLHAAGAREVRIVNRTQERAEALAATYSATASPFTNLIAELSSADAVFATVGAETPVLSTALLGHVDIQREGRRLVVIDMGVPPNVERGLDLPSMEIVGLERLSEQCDANSEVRAAAVPVALEILDEELARLANTMTERTAAPTIQALVEHGEAIRQRNLDWARERLGHLDAKEMRVVEEMARRLMIGLLQAPIESLKTELVASEHREMVERLFSLSGGSSDR